MSLGLEFVSAAALAAIVTAAALSLARRKTAPVPAPPAAVPAPARPARALVGIIRPNPGSVEGLEIRYNDRALVRCARVGAMNCEHKELLLTMDEAQWNSLANAQKQEVLAAARSTWAEKICGAGPDIAYLIVKTERGEIVGRADPRSVTVL